MDKPDWNEIYKQYNFIKNQDTVNITSFIINNMNNEKGFFLNRIGGSDYNSIYNYYSMNKNINSYYFKYDMYNVKNNNGYFDKSIDEDIIKINYIKYLEKMLYCYINSDVYMNPTCTIQKNIKTPMNDFNKIICRDKIMIHYYYIEAITYFINDFKIFGQNKKILIISPFSESIKYQTKKERINNLINNYTFPDFTLLTYDTPITYNNNNDDLDFISTNNWLEQCELMENEIKKLDFDIAFLSCASYANCLGSFISNNMNKKAIYIGGVLNVLFNIYGGRYNDDYYNSINNLEYRITAIEKEKYKNIQGGRDIKSESFNAYF